MRISIPYRWQRRLELAFGILCLLAFVILSSLAVFLHIQHQKPAFDLIIGNGNVFDGQHFLGLGSDVGVRSGKVVEIGFLFGVPAKERINAWRLIVAPGFIDTHVHVEQNMRSKRPMGAGNYVKMGVTTVITGNCGRSFEENHGDSDLKSYDLQHGQVNVAAFVGHNSIRDKIMGKRRDDPSASDLEMMRKEVESAMRAGALGLSLGLEYFPGIISKKEELAFLAAESARWGGLLTAHVRNEGSALNESLDEVIEVADKARSPLHVSHLKIACQKDWGKMSEVLNKLKQARSKLKSLTYDAYAYNASSSSQDLMLPPEFRGSAWRARKSLEDPEQRRRMIEGMVAQMRREGFRDYSFARVSWFREPLLQGHFVSDDWSKLTTQRSYGWLKELVVEPELCRHIANILTIIEGGGAQMIYHVMDPKDVATVIADPFALIGSDSGVRGDNDNTTHPRGSGNTARVLEESVSGRQDFTMEQALHKLTKQSAEVFRLTGRGTIAEGVPADIVVFDPKRIKDTTTWDSPLSAPNGIEYVMVAGQFVYRDGKVIKNYPGRALRAAVTEPTRPAAILRAEPAVQPVREPEEKKPVKRPRKGKGKRN